MMTRESLITSGCVQRHIDLFETRLLRKGANASCMSADVIRAYEMLDIIDTPWPTKDEASAMVGRIQLELDRVLL